MRRFEKPFARDLKSEEDYDLCAEASNGMEAVELARQWRPDLAILDLSMPIMNGYDAALEIKRALPGIRIILFTMYADAVKTRVMAPGSPVDLVVSKTDSAKLIDHVRSLIPA
jgi:DNA-binding NarL/FixJ family response regulator